LRFAFSPALAPARSRLGKALSGLFLSVCLLLPGTLGSSEAASSATSKRSTVKRASTSTKTTLRAGTKARSGKKLVKRSRKHGRTRARAASPARAALVIDARTGEVLYERNAGTPLPIASLTKLMTATVLLETKPDLTRRILVAREDLAGSGKSQLRAGEVVTMRDLLHLSLLSSDNAATKCLVRNSGVESDEFLSRMNRKASVLGLQNTHFVEFTGLSELNVSSATEYAQILKVAGQVPLIAHITTLPDYQFRSSTRDHRLVNTNRLCRYGVFDVKGGKTGFINESGYCLATWVSTRSRDVITVVLGAPSNPARFAETRRLIDRITTPDPTRRSS
jgi:D-alanyl-D-alanine endopeptidase (penicillin-binding protein 7)